MYIKYLYKNLNGYIYKYTQYVCIYVYEHVYRYTHIYNRKKSTLFIFIVVVFPSHSCSLQPLLPRTQYRVVIRICNTKMI